MKYSTFFISILMICLFACQTNDETTQTVSNIKTVSVSDALQYLNQQNLTNRNKSGKANKSVDTYVTDVSTDLTQEYMTDTDELLTVVHVKTKNKKHYSRILLLEIDGEIQSVVFSMTPDESPNSEAYDGEILVTDLEGNFLTGYVFSKGYMETEYVLSNTNPITRKNLTSKDKECDCPFSVCDYCSLGTVFIGGGSDPDIPMINYVVIPPIFGGGTGGDSSGVNGWDVGSAGVGFSGAFGDFMNGLSIEDQNFLVANFDIRNSIQLFLMDNNFSNESVNIANALINAFMANRELTFEDFVYIESSTTPKIKDIKKELNCFDKNESAKLTIYVEQAVENSREVTARLGHTFIGLEQGGTVRNIGFYPDNGGAANLLMNQDSELHDNSGSPFHINITVDVSASQLSDIINYIEDYPKEYDLNNYNCTDFGIAISALGGLILPETIGEKKEFGITLFKGRNPGDLGEDMRELTLPSGASRNSTGGNAPIKSGECP